MQRLLCTYLLIICVYCDNINKGIETENEETKFSENDAKTSVENKYIATEDTKNVTKIINLPKKPLKHDESTEAPKFDEQTKSNMSESKDTATDLKQNGDKRLNNATGIDETSKANVTHYRKHHNHSHRNRHNHSRECHNSRNHNHQQRRHCYQLKKEARRQKKLAKILYPNGVPLESTIAINISKDRNMTFARVIKARKAHDKKIKAWMKKLRRIQHYEYRQKRKQLRRLKTSKDIENSTEAGQLI